MIVELQLNPSEARRTTLINLCKCALLGVEFNCKGFQSVEELDRSVFLGPTRDGRCLYVNKNLIRQNIAKFTCAFDPQYNFSVKSLLHPNGTCFS